jgi:hypothetical protein
VRIE